MAKETRPEAGVATKLNLPLCIVAVYISYRNMLGRLQVGLVSLLNGATLQLPALCVGWTVNKLAAMACLILEQT